MASWSVQPFCRAYQCAKHTHTDHATCDICRNRLHLMHCVQAMRTNNNNNNYNNNNNKRRRKRRRRWDDSYQAWRMRPLILRWRHSMTSRGIPRSRDALMTSRSVARHFHNPLPVERMSLISIRLLPWPRSTTCSSDAQYRYFWNNHSNGRRTSITVDVADIKITF